jgi:hypothetical protein
MKQNYLYQYFGTLISRINSQLRLPLIKNLNVLWESTSELRKAVSHVDMQERLSKYPGSTMVTP